MVNPLSLIKHTFGKLASRALDEQQSDSDDLAGIGWLKRDLAEHPTRGLTPAKLHAIMEGAESGDLMAQSDLFEDMEERDAQIGSDLAKRRQQAAELEWQIVPPENPTRAERLAAEQAAEVFSGLEVEDLVIDLGSGLGHGWANLELPWARDGQARIIEQPILRPHRWFQLHPEDQNLLRLRDMSAEGEALWPLGWLQHRHRAKPGYVARSGLHRQLAWPYLFANYALGDLAELLEIYGLPIRLGSYPRGSSKEQKNTLMRALLGIGHNGAGMVPEGMKIEFKEAAAGRSEMFETMLTWCERAKAKVILGGTLTSGTGEGTNTNALGNVHERGLMSLIRSDVRQYAGTINRDLLWPMAMLNYGIADRRRAPRFYLDTGEAEDYKALADSLPIFVDMGAKIPLWWVHEKTRIPRATDTEVTQGDILTPKLASTGATPGEGPAPATESVQQTALNGAQIKSLSEVIAQVQTGALDRDRAKALIEAGFPAIGADQVERLLGEAIAAAPARAALPAGWTALRPAPEQKPAQPGHYTDPATPVLAGAANPIVEDWVDQLDALLQQAEADGLSLAQFEERLLDAYGDLPTEQLTNLMAEAFAAAHLGGRDSLETDG